ncbi:MAG: helix-turn-helix domain-containing protein [Bacteroidales bacterium]|nr:helix-turn-helix domain-containing protein [Bacteroidales bacterium]MCF8458947.1 helix-turn-helix domain-containing protein [Bacteroidales bacterium]
MQEIVTTLSKQELSEMMVEAVRAAMPSDAKKSNPQPFIKGIHELAKFLRVSPAKAQKLKNEGAIPFWQEGRTVLFNPDKVREVMEVINKKKGSHD